MIRIPFILVFLTAILLIACSEDKPTKPEYDYLHVPAEYATIQEAVDAAVSGDTILIAPGTYTGEGNRNINIHNKACE